MGECQVGDVSGSESGVQVYNRLTDKGRKQLLVEASQWKEMMEAVARVMWPAAEES